MNTFSFMDRLFCVNLDTGNGIAVVNGNKHEYRILHQSPDRLLMQLDSRVIPLLYCRDEDKISIEYNGKTYVFNVNRQDRDTRDSSAVNAGGEALIIRAPMPGTVLKVNVREAELVNEGDCLAILEAMKMETGLHAPCKAAVKHIHAKAGMQVSAGDILIELDSEC